MANQPRSAAFRRIIVLANSIKKGARCVAGKDVGIGCKLAAGEWIRPISGESEGELEPRHMRLEGGAPLKVLEIVDVPLSRCANDPVHPEDWVVDMTRRWKKTGELDSKNLGTLEEQPNDLWLQSTMHTDRVTRQFLLKQGKPQSLYLVRPTDLRVELSCEHNPHKNKDQKKTRAKFRYRRLQYQMNLTDPVFTDRYCTKFPALGARPITVCPDAGDNCLICVSLTPEFNGYHYKVVATILELP
jgi:hypothetical protein